MATQPSRTSSRQLAARSRGRIKPRLFDKRRRRLDRPSEADGTGLIRTSSPERPTGRGRGRLPATSRGNRLHLTAHESGAQTSTHEGKTRTSSHPSFALSSRGDSGHISLVNPATAIGREHNGTASIRASSASERCVDGGGLGSATGHAARQPHDAIGVQTSTAAVPMTLISGVDGPFGLAVASARDHQSPLSRPEQAPSRRIRSAASEEGSSSADARWTRRRQEQAVDELAKHRGHRRRSARSGAEDLGQRCWMRRACQISLGGAAAKCLTALS